MSSHVETKKFSHGESCTEEGCRAKKWYIEDGKKFCQRGHEQFGFTQTQQDEDDFGTKGKTSRKAREEKEKVEKVLKGSSAADLYLQCLQFVLWKQCHWLVNSKGFPPELEAIVRDLWSLRIHDLEKEERSGYGSTMFSSQGEDTDTDGTGFKSTSSKRSRKSVVEKGKMPKLIETLGLCYLGMVLLKLPISLGEMCSWVTREEIVYSRAIKEIPKETRARLPAYYFSALEIRAEFRGSMLHRTALQLVEFFHSNFEMAFPALNAHLLVYKHITDLALPIEVIPAVHRLAEKLGFSFTYPIPDKRAYEIHVYPEFQIVSLVVLATKLLYPFDNMTRIPEYDTDPTVLKIDWAKWRKIMGEDDGNDDTQGEQIKVKDTDVLGMNGAGMDAFMNWYEGTMIDDRDSKMPPQLLELFPLPSITPTPAPVPKDQDRHQRLKEVQQSLIYQKPRRASETEKEVKRSGELYRKYRTEEDLPGDARVFYEKAAANTGISLKMLVRGVVQLETMLEAWNLGERKKRALAEQQEIAMEEEEEDGSE